MKISKRLADLQRKMSEQLDTMRKKLLRGARELEESYESQMVLCTQIDKLKHKKIVLSQNIEDDQKILYHLSQLCNNEIEGEAPKNDYDKQSDEQEIIEYIIQLEKELQQLNEIRSQLLKQRSSLNNNS